MDVSKNSGTTKSSSLIGFSIINHPFWGTPVFGNTQIAPYVDNRDLLGTPWASLPRLSFPSLHHLENMWFHTPPKKINPQIWLFQHLQGVGCLTYLMLQAVIFHRHPLGFFKGRYYPRVSCWFENLQPLNLSEKKAPSGGFPPFGP